MISELERLQRGLEAETRQWLEEIGQRLQALESLANQRRTLIAALDILPAPADVEASRAELLDRRALLTEPYRQRAVADLLAEIRKAQVLWTAQVDTWQRALKSVEDGLRVAASGGAREAIAHFELTLRIEPASRCASVEADRCRATIEAQRAIDERAAAMIEEARRAAAAKQWPAVIVLCDDALRLDARAAEATALKHKAEVEIETAARERSRESERALGRAEAYLRKGRFQEATAEIARARALEPTAAVDAADARLRDAIAEAERDVLWGKQAAEAIAAARTAFSGGRRDEALAEIRSVHARVPHAMIAAEITRLDAEAKRLAAAEQRAAEAAAHAKAAEAALTDGNPEEALALATRALAIDSGHLLARKVSGMASAQVKQRAEAKARAAKAARHIEEAKEQIARGRFPKARELVGGRRTDPNSQHSSCSRVCRKRRRAPRRRPSSNGWRSSARRPWPRSSNARAAGRRVITTRA
jgi:hypothetical protein